MSVIIHGICYIFVTGGPYSGVGKGVIASAIGLLLKARGIIVTVIKIDGYYNIDAGTMSPFEHGEVYVTADGGETDLDLGNYERFLGLELTRASSMTMGKIYESVAKRERAGEYLGQTVQVVPHVTDEIARWIREVAGTPVVIDGSEPAIADVCIVEIGGTVGDMETLPVFHAIKHMCADSTDEQFCFIHVSALSYVGSSDGDREPKTKPTQHNVEELGKLGIYPDLLIMRCEKPISDVVRRKLHTHCRVPMEGIISSYDVKNIHFVPQILKDQNVIGFLETKLNLKLNRVWKLEKYYELLEYFENDKLPIVKLAVVGKYTGMNDTYLSLIRAIQHGGFANQVHVEITWIEADTLQSADLLNHFDGVLVPGGFGTRGIKGMQNAVEFCIEKSIPYFGICLGMQVMVCEVAKKNKEFDYQRPISSEWYDGTKIPQSRVIDLLPEQDQKLLGGTMRLGNYETAIVEGSLAHKIYGTGGVIERHRHRYEVNREYVEELSKVMTFSGYHIRTGLKEIVEVNGHPFMIACQFHPEYISRYWKPHPLFIAFVKACLEFSKHN
jgi:CTP synthase